MPLNKPTARKADRQLASAAESSERTEPAGRRPAALTRRLAARHRARGCGVGGTLRYAAAGAEHCQATETAHRHRDEHRAYRPIPAGEQKKSDDACDERQADKPHLRLRRTNGCAHRPERRVTEPHSHDTPFTSLARQLPPLA